MCQNNVRNIVINIGGHRHLPHYSTDLYKTCQWPCLRRRDQQQWQRCSFAGGVSFRMEQSSLLLPFGILQTSHFGGLSSDLPSILVIMKETYCTVRDPEFSSCLQDVLTILGLIVSIEGVAVWKSVLGQSPMCLWPRKEQLALIELLSSQVLARQNYSKPLRSLKSQPP